MPTYKIPDAPYNRKIVDILINYPDNKVPKLVVLDNEIQIITNDFKVDIKLKKEDKVAAKNRVG